jgi:hypothetical protein
MAELLSTKNKLFTKITNKMQPVALLFLYLELLISFKYLPLQPETMLLVE